MINTDLVASAIPKLVAEFALNVFSDDYIDTVLIHSTKHSYKCNYYFNRHHSIPNLSKIMNGILEKYSSDELDALKIAVSLLTASYPTKYNLRYRIIDYSKLKSNDNLTYYKFLKEIKNLLENDVINTRATREIAIYDSIILKINQYGYLPKILENINKRCNFNLELHEYPSTQCCSHDKANVIFGLRYKDKITESWIGNDGHHFFNAEKCIWESRLSIYDYFAKAEDGQIKSINELRHIIISEIFETILNEADLARQRSMMLSIIEDFSSNIFEYISLGIFADILCNSKYMKICIQGNNYVTHNLKYNNQSTKEIIDANIQYIAFIKNIIKYFEKTKLPYEDIKSYLINDKSSSLSKRLFLSKMVAFDALTIEDAYKLAIFFEEDSIPFAQQMAALINHTQFYFDGHRASRVFSIDEFKKLFKSKSDVLLSVSEKNTDISKLTKADIFKLNDDSIFLLTDSSDEDILKYIKSKSSMLIHRSLSTFVDFYKHPKSWQALSMKRDFIVLTNLILNADKFIIPTLMGRIELKTMKDYKETLNIVIEKAITQNE